MIIHIPLYLVMTTLNQVLNDNIHAEKICTELRQYGFAFIKVDWEQEDIKESCQLLFNNSDRCEALNYGQDIGYFENINKQQLHLLTGQYDKPDLRKHGHAKLYQFGQNFDGLIRLLTATLNTHLFRLNKDDVQRLSLFGKYKAGILDIVKYKSRPKGVTLVHDHVDPGLFSFNVYSSASGMLFRKMIGGKATWIPLPEGYGAIFLGQAAYDMCGLIAARHMVISSGTERLSIWYELGLNEQISEHETLPIPATNEKGRIITVVGEDGIKRKVTWTGSSTFELKKSIERTMGIPTSKSLGVSLPLGPRTPVQAWDIRGGRIKPYNYYG